MVINALGVKGESKTKSLEPTLFEILCSVNLVSAIFIVSLKWWKTEIRCLKAHLHKKAWGSDRVHSSESIVSSVESLSFRLRLILLIIFPSLEGDPSDSRLGICANSSPPLHLTGLRLCHSNLWKLQQSICWSDGIILIHDTFLFSQKVPACYTYNIEMNFYVNVCSSHTILTLRCIHQLESFT